MTAPPRPFTREEVARFLAFADETLAKPPARPWIERTEGRGVRLFRFVLPLAMTRGANDAIRHRAGWALAKERSSVLAAMAGQMCDQLRDARGRLPDHMRYCPNGRGLTPVYPEALAGRPHLRCVRFSSVPTDDTAAWWKTVGDVLLEPQEARVVVSKKTGARRMVKAVAGLGMLRGDDPSRLLTSAWWEPAARGCGVALVEVWDGSASAGNAPPESSTSPVMCGTGRR